MNENKQSKLEASDQAGKADIDEFCTIPYDFAVASALAVFKRDGNANPTPSDVAQAKCLVCGWTTDAHSKSSDKTSTSLPPSTSPSYSMPATPLLSAFPPATYNDSAHKSKIITYLQNSKEPRFSRTNRVIAPDSLAIPFAPSRLITIKHLNDYILREANIPYLDRGAKSVHSIGLLATLSKFGKTRTLFELKDRLPMNDSSTRVFKVLYMTYNQGYEESCTERGYKDVESLFAWRLLYFYFSPSILWYEYIHLITDDSNGVIWLSVEQAVSIITNDIRRVDGLPESTCVVLVLGIDEYQLISDNDKQCLRLTEIVRALFGAMCTMDGLKAIVVPVFTGLFSLPLLSVIDHCTYAPTVIPMSPFSYEDATALVRHCLGDSKVMSDPAVQHYVHLFGAIPGLLVQLIHRYKQTSSWSESSAHVNSNKYEWVMGNMYESLLQLAAYSLTALRLPSYLREASEMSGVCWYRRQAVGYEKTVGVPAGLVHMIGKYVYWVGRSAWIAPSFLVAYKDCLGALSQYKSPRAGSDYTLKVFEHGLASIYLALKLNSYGFLEQQQLKWQQQPEQTEAFISLGDLLSGAYLSTDASFITLRIKPMVACISYTPLTAEYTFGGGAAGSAWEHGRCLILGSDKQHVVNSYAIFRNASLDARVFDLFYFSQSSYKHGHHESLVPETYTDAVEWCRGIVQTYKKRWPEREVGFIYGVTDPIKPLSSLLKAHIDELSNPDDLEFLYALGRQECMVHYDLLSVHPGLVPRVYINQDGLDKHLLAAVLPPSWTHPLKRAEQLLLSRLTYGYTDWATVAAHAVLPGDSEEGVILEVEIPGDVESSVVYFV